MVVGIAIAPKPLNTCDAHIHIQPRILFLVLAPPEIAEPYLQTVSAIMQLLERADLVQKLIQAESVADVLRLDGLQKHKIRPKLAVRDVMTHRVITITPDASLGDVVSLMVRHLLQAIPVVGEKREVVGMVTDREVTRALLPQIPRAGAKPETEQEASMCNVQVREIMSRSVLCISEDMDLRELASTLVNKDVDHVPVVSEGVLTGIITRADFIRKLFAR